VALGETYYRFEAADGCSIISLLPELNDKQWADIEKVGTELVDRLSTIKAPRIIVDLTALTYMGSAMVALIVRLYKSVSGRDGKMVVVNQHELVQEVLKLAGLAKLWTIVDSRDKAFASLGIKPGSVRRVSVGAPGGNGLLVGGIIGTVGAIIGLALQFSSSPIVSAKIAQLIEIAFAMLGMVMGTMTLVYQSGARRNVGIGVLSFACSSFLAGFSPHRITVQNQPHRLRAARRRRHRAPIPPHRQRDRPWFRQLEPMLPLPLRHRLPKPETRKIPRQRN
jgi:anti-anti-sigma factor